MDRPGQNLSSPRRLLIAAAGGVLAVIALPVSVFLPEFGIPLLLLALRLLAFQFEWAAKANEWIDDRWRRFRSWFGRAPLAVRAALLLVLVALAIVAGWLLLDHL